MPTYQISSVELNDSANEWPWRRVARWCHNWRQLLTLWCWLGLPLSLLREWQGLDLARKNILLPQWLPVTLTVSFGGLVACFFLFIVARRQITRSPALAAVCLRSALLLLLVLDVTALLLARNFGGNLVGPVTAVGFHLVLLLLVRPLQSERFSKFADLLGQVSNHGVPHRFLRRIPFFGSPTPVSFSLTETYQVAEDEPVIALSRIKTVRLLTRNSLVLPKDVDFTSRKAA